MISSSYFWKPTYDDALTAADGTGLDVEISLQYNRLCFLENNLCFVGTDVIVHETFAYSRVVPDICQLPMPFVPDLGIMALMLHLYAWQLLESQSYQPLTSSRVAHIRTASVTSQGCGTRRDSSRWAQRHTDSNLLKDVHEFIFALMMILGQVKGREADFVSDVASKIPLLGVVVVEVAAKAAVPLQSS
jgi:hypothetical protein